MKTNRDPLCRVDTIEDMKSTLAQLRQQLAKETDYFRHVYNYTFEFSRPPGQRSLGACRFCLCLAPASFRFAFRPTPPPPFTTPIIQHPTASHTPLDRI